MTEAQDATFYKLIYRDDDMNNWRNVGVWSALAVRALPGFNDFSN